MSDAPVLDPKDPKFYLAPDLLRAFVETYPTAAAAAEALGVAKSELSSWLNRHQRPGGTKRTLIRVRTCDRVPEPAWLTNEEQAAIYGARAAEARS